MSQYTLVKEIGHKALCQCTLAAMLQYIIQAATATIALAYILKATQSADSVFPISKSLRKNCVNRDDKISRQKCVNHKNHKNLVSMWHFC